MEQPTHAASPARAAVTDTAPSAAPRRRRRREPRGGAPPATREAYRAAPRPTTNHRLTASPGPCTICPMLRMRRALAELAVCATCTLAPLSWTSGALAADASPEQLQFAAQEHDLGYRAYTAKSYEEAATHFENAFFAAPNPAELRSAIRARREAGQIAHAATLAVIGKRRYPGEAAMVKLADETIAEARPKVFEVHATSSVECSVAVDDKVVAGEKLREYRFFVDQGRQELVFGWSEGRSKRVPIDAKAGGTQSFALEPPPLPPHPHIDQPSPELPPPAPKPLGPAVFFAGA